MAKISFVGHTSNTITVKITELDSSYDGSVRKVSWYVDNVWVKENYINNKISETPEVIFYGHSDTVYTLKAVISNISGSSNVTLSLETCTDENDGTGAKLELMEISNSSLSFRLINLDPSYTSSDREVIYNIESPVSFTFGGYYLDGGVTFSDEHVLGIIISEGAVTVKLEWLCVDGDGNILADGIFDEEFTISSTENIDISNISLSCVDFQTCGVTFSASNVKAGAYGSVSVEKLITDNNGNVSIQTIYKAEIDDFLNYRDANGKYYIEALVNSSGTYLIAVSVYNVEGGQGYVRVEKEYIITYEARIKSFTLRQSEFDTFKVDCSWVVDIPDGIEYSYVIEAAHGIEKIYYTKCNDNTSEKEKTVTITLDKQAAYYVRFKLLVMIDGEIKTDTVTKHIVYSSNPYRYVKLVHTEYKVNQLPGVNTTYQYDTDLTFGLEGIEEDTTGRYAIYSLSRYFADGYYEKEEASEGSSEPIPLRYSEDKSVIAEYTFAKTEYRAQMYCTCSIYENDGTLIKKIFQQPVSPVYNYSDNTILYLKAYQGSSDKVYFEFDIDTSGDAFPYEVADLAVLNDYNDETKKYDGSFYAFYMDNLNSVMIQPYGNYSISAAFDIDKKTFENINRIQLQLNGWLGGGFWNTTAYTYVRTNPIDIRIWEFKAIQKEDGSIECDISFGNLGRCKLYVKCGSQVVADGVELYDTSNYTATFIPLEKGDLTLTAYIVAGGYTSDVAITQIYIPIDERPEKFTWINGVSLEADVNKEDGEKTPDGNIVFSLTSEEWKRLISNINNVRIYRQCEAYPFTSICIEKGDKITAQIYNEAVEAITSIGKNGEYGAYLSTVSKEGDITATLLDLLKNEINAIP